MRTVWKFPVPVTDEFTLTLPSAHKVVHVGPDPSGEPHMWVEVQLPVDEDAINVTFFVEGTGHTLVDGAEHVGTWVADPFAWHLYETVAGRRDPGLS